MQRVPQGVVVTDKYVVAAADIVGHMKRLLLLERRQGEHVLAGWLIGTEHTLPKGPEVRGHVAEDLEVGLDCHQQRHSLPGSRRGICATEQRPPHCRPPALYDLAIGELNIC